MALCKMALQFSLSEHRLSGISLDSWNSSKSVSTWESILLYPCKFQVQLFPILMFVLFIIHTISDFLVLWNNIAQGWLWLQFTSVMLFLSFFFFICFSLIYNPHEYHLVSKVFLKITQFILGQCPSICVGIKYECWLNFWIAWRSW